MKFSAVCIDCDGTIVDSEPQHWQSWQSTLKQWNIEFDFNYFATHWVGMPAGKFSEYLVEKHQLPLTALELQQQKEHDFEQLCTKQPIPLVEGIKDTIIHLYQQEIPLAVVSGGFRKNVLEAINHHNLAQYFNTVVTGDDVSNNKPAPDAYLAAAKQLAIEPTKIAAIEDSENGIKSAKSAGLFCYALQHSYAPDSKLSLADRKLPNHRDILNDLIS